MIKTKAPVLSVLFLAMAGSAWLWFVTARWGMGLFPDSTAYLAAARSLLAGEGFLEAPRWHEVRPLLSFPPLCSILLAAVGFWGTGLMEAVRLVNLFFFGMNIALVGGLVFNGTHSRAGALLGAFFAMTSLVLLEVHAVACSEPAFLFFGFLGLCLLARWLEGGAPAALFFASAGLVSLAFLTKYSGISFVATGILGIFLLGKAPVSKRILLGLLFGGGSGFPMLLWLIRNRIVSGYPIELSWYFEPYLLGHLRQVAAYTSLWLVPEKFPVVARAAALAIFLALFLKGAFGSFRRGQIKSPLFWILAFFPACHIGTYLFITVFLGEQPFDNRALSPVFIAGLAAAIWVASCAWRNSKPGGALRAGFLLLTLLLSFSYLLQAAGWGMRVRREGLGYAGRLWQRSEVIAAVKKLPLEMAIYTNGRDVIYLATSNPVSAIPAKEDILKVHVPAARREPRQAYASELVRMKDELRRSDGVVVYLNRIDWRWYYPTEEELAALVPLRAVQKFPDGTIYKVKE